MDNKRLALILIFVFLGNISFAWEAESMNMHFRRGESFYEQGRYYEAVQEFQKVLEMYPDNAFAKKYIKRAEEKIRLESAVSRRRAIRDKKQIQKQEEIARQKQLAVVKKEQAPLEAEKKRQEELARIEEKQKTEETRLDKAELEKEKESIARPFRLKLRLNSKAKE